MRQFLFKSSLGRTLLIAAAVIAASLLIPFGWIILWVVIDWIREDSDDR